MNVNEKRSADLPVEDVTSIDQFAGVFVPRDVDHHDRKLRFFVKEISTEEAESILIDAESGQIDKAKARTFRSRLISACIFKSDKTPIGSPEVVRKTVPPGLSQKLQTIAMEVNNMQQNAMEAAAKNSSPTDESGTS